MERNKLGEPTVERYVRIGYGLDGKSHPRAASFLSVTRVMVAEKAGFEPAVGFTLRTLSRRVT